VPAPRRPRPLSPLEYALATLPTYLVLAVTLYLAACGGGGAALPSDATAVALPLADVGATPASVSIAAGATQPLAVLARDAQGRALAGVSLGFASGDTLVARVDDAGVVRGVAAGSTQVTVTARQDTIQRTLVVPVSVAASGGTGGTGGNVVTTSGALFVPASITIAAGAAVTWQISGATHNVSFGTAKPAEGDVPDLAPGGSATRTFPVAGSFPYQCTRHSGMTGTVVVQGAEAPVFTSVAVSPATPSITVGGSASLVATALDQNGSAMTGLPAATWTTSDAAVARVANGGVVSGAGAGTATVTATIASGGVTRSGTAAVTVTQPGAGNATVTTPSLTFQPNVVTIATGGTVTWQFSGSTHNVTFGALRPPGGNIPDTDEGNAASRTFTAAGSYDYQCTRHSGMTGRVVVQASGSGGQYASLSLAPASLFLAPGTSAQLVATPLDGVGAPMSGLGTPTFTSTAEGVARVAATGLVTAVASGTARVIASLTVAGVTRADTTDVTVGTPAATVRTTAGAFTPDDVSIRPGGTVVWEIAGATHNVTFDEETPPDGSIPDTPAGRSVARTFATAGDYDYRCTLHQGMKGRIRVR
jgi:plastocyanin